MRTRSSLVAALFAGAVFLFPVLTAAQEAGTPPRPSGAPARPAPPNSDIEEIIILGEESESAQDFAGGDSVTGFNAADLAALGAQSVEDLAAFTPNLEIVSSGATTPTFFIRGVGLQDFNANAVSSVAIYQDDVNLNAAGLALGTLFDMEAVNVLRGPQGTGLARNASAGAIKLYTKKPTGEFGGYFSSQFGNFNFRDYEGAVEAPLYGDLLSARVAFRLSTRDGFMKNGCGGLDSNGQLSRAIANSDTNQKFKGATPIPIATCDKVLFPFRDPTNPFSTFLGNPTVTPPNADSLSVRANLPERVNNLDNWAARGTLLFQPTLDMSWLINAHGSRRDELSRLGLSYGTGETNNTDLNVDLPDGTSVSNIFPNTDSSNPTRPDLGWIRPEIARALNARYRQLQAGCSADPSCTLTVPQLQSKARLQVGEALANDLDDVDAHPYTGYYDRVGPTKQDIWGGYVRGDIVFDNGVEFKTVTGYDSYDRLIELDLDFSPTSLFSFETEDSLFQFSQDFLFSGDFGEDSPLRWELGSFFLYEELDVDPIDIDLGLRSGAGDRVVLRREYTQRIRSFGTFGSFEWDLGRDFTLDGGIRFNWESKSGRFHIFNGQRAAQPPRKTTEILDRTWSAPTGTIRLTYRFREDTHAYWKYSRGWKAGHFNATSSPRRGITTADPETIDAFETGLRGAWFGGALGLDASLFYYSYQDYQVFTVEQEINSSPAFSVFNASDAEVYGAEIDAIARPWVGAFLNLRFSWLESQYLDFVQEQFTRTFDRQGGRIVDSVVSVNNTGNPLINSPQFKLSITAEQRLPMGRFGSLTPRYDGVWTDDVAYDPNGGTGFPEAGGQVFLPEHAIGQRAYWLHNASVSYSPPGGNFELTFWVKNLTAQVYRNYAADATAFAATTIHFLGDPRTYGLRFSTNF